VGGNRLQPELTVLRCIKAAAVPVGSAYRFLAIPMIWRM
jgi:hypothetical protein